MGLEEVLIRSAASASDFLALRAEPWSGNGDDWYEGPDVRIDLSSGRLHAESILPAYVADAKCLAALFHDIDRDWRGWAGEKVAGVPERDWFSVTAVHDGRGHVLLTVRLSDGWPVDVAWSVLATLEIDVGSAVSIANALDRWLALVSPPEQRWPEHA